MPNCLQVSETSAPQKKVFWRKVLEISATSIDYNPHVESSVLQTGSKHKEPMYMKDWLETIDDYLKMTRRDILTSSGHISHKQAIEKAHAEYDKYKNLWFTLNYDFLNLTFGLCKNSPIRTGIFL